ncbi:MAG: hypothetical protein PVJ34_14595 [Anaerolineae bacterium]
MRTHDDQVRAQFVDVGDDAARHVALWRRVHVPFDADAPWKGTARDFGQVDCRLVCVGQVSPTRVFSAIVRFHRFILS